MPSAVIADAAAKGGALLTVAGVHTALWAGAPGLAAALTLLEAALAATVVLTALYAPERLSDRAFRMLPWTARAPARRRASPGTGSREGG
ncbi:hypothetical protein [Spongiactinospora sp. TRM90649]|uniref:hypothetical protein n=1 Tax=Spongiactinospora sp. TRM90649 TaxID=3031114 RepID=UPI0023F89EF6|nr:hypothetical protein [Spongiactinospora sp. TRM90649]MDF5751755.1 hypothetical protein [Spongiactinospora sp. TRM90649]